jgi:hypothetical protein
VAVRPEGRVRQRKRHGWERFIFDPSGDRFTYEATYTDPTVLTKPFTITIPAKRVTDKTQVDDWNNETFLAKHEGSDPIIEDYERSAWRATVLTDRLPPTQSRARAALS